MEIFDAVVVVKAVFHVFGTPRVLGSLHGSVVAIVRSVSGNLVVRHHPNGVFRGCSCARF